MSTLHGKKDFVDTIKALKMERFLDYPGGSKVMARIFIREVRCVREKRYDDRAEESVCG